MSPAELRGGESPSATADELGEVEYGPPADKNGSGESCDAVLGEPMLTLDDLRPSLAIAFFQPDCEARDSAGEGGGDVGS